MRISEMEALAVLSLLRDETQMSELKGKHIVLSVDNADVVWTMVKARHKSTRMAALVYAIDEALDQLDSTLWIDYVATNRNAADMFTREDLLTQLRERFDIETYHMHHVVLPPFHPKCISMSPRLH